MWSGTKAASSGRPGTPPDSGPTPTGYTLQWKESVDDWDDANDVSEANVNGTSHVITGLTGGVQYAVRVIAYKGDAESDPSGEITATPQETVPPSPSAASVDGATLTITFDEPLDTGEAPDKSSFAVTVAGSSRGVDTVSVSGSVVTLTLVTTVFAGEAVTVDYTVPTGATADRLRDLAGNAAASFSGQDATNATQAADQLTASVSVVPESHDGSTVFTFELRFSEAPRKRFSYKIMRDLAFTVTGGEVTGARAAGPGEQRRLGDPLTAGRQRTDNHRAPGHLGLHGGGRDLHRGPQAALQPSGDHGPRTGRVGPCRNTQGGRVVASSRMVSH